MDMQFGDRKRILILMAILALTLAKPAIRIETNPELTAGYVEGDMVLDIKARNGLRNQVYKWPNNIVYCKFFTQFDEPYKNQILRGMQTIESVSCIRFKEATIDTISYVNITGFNRGCYSNVGYLNKGPQTYNLHKIDLGCFRLGTIIHEFLHTLGFYHMQSAFDRDDYVRIVEENIIKGMEHNFKKYSENQTDNYDMEYDYGSILHYPANAFSANGEMTIIPLRAKEAVNIMGQRGEMSQSDINKLNVMYRCPLKH